MQSDLKGRFLISAVLARSTCSQSDNGWCYICEILSPGVLHLSDFLICELELQSMLDPAIGYRVKMLKPVTISQDGELADFAFVSLQYSAS